MKTEQHQQTKREQKECYKMTFWEWLASFLGFKKSPERLEPEIAGESEQNTLMDTQSVTENNSQSEITEDAMKESGVNTAASDIQHDKDCQQVPLSIATEQSSEIQSEDYSVVFQSFRQNDILKDNEDWRAVNWDERLQLHAINKCICCWNCMYPDEAVDENMNTLDDFLRLIHSGFVGINNREKLDDWFQETAVEFNWDIRSMEWLQNPKRFLTVAKVGMKRYYEQLDKKIEKVLLDVLNEWQSKQDENTVLSLHKRIEELEAEKESLSAEVIRINKENELLSSSLQEAIKNYQILKDEYDKKTRELVEANKKVEKLSVDLQEAERKLEELQSKNEELAIDSANLSEVIGNLEEIRKQWIVGFFTKLDEIGLELNEMVQKVADTNPESSIYRNLLERASTSYATTREEVIPPKAQPDWKGGMIEVKEMVRQIQSVLQGSLKRNGWVNILTYLNCYSYIPQVVTEFNTHALNVLQLGRLHSLVIALLEKIQISMFVPRLLVDQFDNNYYEFKNSDTWINKFCPAISPRDYAGKVFDLIQVGYQIQGNEQTSCKPIVVYF